MYKVYFHIGFGKTGSSSLQSYLSCSLPHNSTIDNSKLLYCSIQENGEVFFGEELRKKAVDSPLHYVSSAQDIATKCDLSSLKKGIKEIIRSGYTPIFSQEDWGRRAGEFKTVQFFDYLGVKADVLVYVRPQVEWFNSAWWQWYAWDGSFSRPEDVINVWGYPFMLWAAQINQWKKISGVENVIVRLHSGNIVEDFCHTLNLKPTTGDKESIRNNIGLNPVLIKLLKKFPEFRKVHSAELDAILSKLISAPGRPPWVIDPALAKNIINKTSMDNKNLVEMLDEKSADIMKADKRWWDHKYYSDNQPLKDEGYFLNDAERQMILDRLPATADKLSEKLNLYGLNSEAVGQWVVDILGLRSAIEQRSG